MSPKRPVSAPDPRHILAESPRYLVYHLYETAYLHFKGAARTDIAIGCFYGDPQTGYMAPDETYCVLGGCGLLLYYLREPFDDYNHHPTSANWWEWGQEADNIYWIESIYSPDDPTAEIRFVVDPYDEARGGVYQLDLADRVVTKLC
jgi:hypothetical protein